MTQESAASRLQIELSRQLLESIVLGTYHVGDHMREVELAQKFGVSRTPLRGALSFLADIGALEKRANKGFFVIGDKPTCDRILAQLPVSDDERIKDQIAKDWFEGKINKEISEGEIRTRYKLGRMTATRLLTEMAESGVVSRMPGYGWQFEPTLNSAAAHDESYAFRMILEPSSIRSPEFRYNGSLADNLRRRHETVLASKAAPPVLGVLFRLDADFHNFIADCACNRFTKLAIEQQNRLRRLLEYNSLIDAGRLVDSCLEHLAILDNLDQRQNEMAAALMEDHLQRAKESAPVFAILGGHSN